MLTHQAIRDCQSNGSEPYEIYQAHVSEKITYPFVEVKRFLKILSPERNKNIVRGHYAIISNPLKTISVLEPGQQNGCSYHLRKTVRETSLQRKCEVAVNAGYFDTRNGKCLGNIISDGELVHSSGGIQNAHFGLLKNNSLFFGYVSELDVLKKEFSQLVGGVIWVTRNSNDYTNISKDFECEDTEETGPMKEFISIRSSRTIIGSDKYGKVIIIQIDGKSKESGVSLWELHSLMQDMGIINAINLDGGGSSTFVVNGTVVNYPSDKCPNEDFICERNVSTIICIHPPDCDPPNCNGHGHCDMGICICEKYFLPPDCVKLSCEKNCSLHGICTEDGCSCQSGFYGEICNFTCPDGWFGNKCKKPCTCLNGAKCNHQNGTCLCSLGFYGNKCQKACPLGFYGHNCNSVCSCGSSCYCDPINGSCVAETNSVPYALAKCLADDLIKNRHLVKDFDLKRNFVLFVIVLSVVISSIIGSAAVYIYDFSCHYCKNKRKNQHQRSYTGLRTISRASDSSEGEENIEPTN